MAAASNVRGADRGCIATKVSDDQLIKQKRACQGGGRREKGAKRDEKNLRERYIPSPYFSFSQ